MKPGFQCGSCGQWHDELPLDFGFQEPDYVHELDASERARFVTGKGDFRELQQDESLHYFIRGVIEIPIVGTDDVFRYGVWTSLSAESCATARDAYEWDAAAGPFFGWVSNRVPNYPSTMNLRAQVHVRSSVRSAIELEPTTHPLALEQRNGITMDRVREIIERVMHPTPH
ncbi:MAG TPA: DUF2199 domain-containing protein [Kofleriaceae bacterium]|jgi:hypothetical protein